MGNVLAQEGILPAEEDAVDSDRQFLMLGSATIFNDSYLMDNFDKLPPFAGTEVEDLDDDAGDATGSSGGAGAGSNGWASQVGALDALRQLQYALRNRSSGIVASVEAFPALGYDAKGGAAVDDGYHRLMKMRSRLLQRIHLAMLRDFKRGRDAGGGGTDASNYMSAPPLKEDMSITMTAFAVRMSVTTMKAMAQTNPSVASDMCRSLLELLERVDASVLQRIQPGSVAEDMVGSIIEFTKDAATLWGLGDEARGEALGLLLSLGTTRGNIGDICTVADTMLRRPAPLPEHLSLKFAQTVESRLTPAELTLTEYGFANHHVQVRQVRRPEARAPAVAAAVATDGEFLYAYDPASAELIKAGTGFHGTVAGNLVQFNTKRTVPAMIRRWKQAQSVEAVAATHEDSPEGADAVDGLIERCWIAVCNNALYLKAYAAHNKCALRPDEVAIFHLETLELRSIRTLQLPVEKWVQAQNVSAGLEEPEVILSERMNLATSTSGGAISGHVTNDEGEERALSEEEVAHLAAICDGTQGDPFELACKSISVTVTLGERSEIVTHVGGFFRTTARPGDDDNDSNSESDDEERENTTFVGAIDIAIAGDDAYFTEYHSEDGSALPHDGFSPVVLPNDEGPPYESSYRVALGTVETEGSEASQGLRPKRIRFRLSPAEDAGAVVIGTVLVTGQERLVDDGSIPCPAIVSDGRRLQFPVLEGAGRTQRLMIYELPAQALDGEDASSMGTLICEVPVDDGCLAAGDNAISGVVPGALHGNRDFLGITVMQGAGGEDEEGKGLAASYLIGDRHDGVERTTRSWRVNMSKFTGSIRAGNGSEAVKWASEPLAWHAAPDATTYDPLNNMVWFFDALSCKCQAFRNVGPAPRLYPTTGSSDLADDERLFCEDPSIRLKAIEATTSGAGAGPAAQAAILMTSLEILGERYAPPLKRVPAQVEAHFEARVVSCTSARFSELSFFLRGQDLIRSGYTTAGIYMLLLDESLEHAEGALHHFSTENPANGERMADFVDSVPPGRTVMVGVGLDGHTNLLETRRGKDALVALGVRREHLANFAKDDAFALIGRKGAAPEEIKYRKVSQPNVASVSQRLPTPSIPFTLTPDSGTFRALTSILLENWDIFTDAEFGAAMNAGGLTARRCKMRVAVLLSTLNVVGVHIYQSLQGMAAEDVRTFVGEAAIPQLTEKLVAVIDTPPSGFPGAAELGAAALRFFVYGVDLFYPTAGEQTALMVDYLKQHRAGELSQSEAFVLDMLIQRASRPETLQRLLNVETKVADAASASALVPGQKRRSITSSGADLLDSLLAIATSEYSMQLSRFSDQAAAPTAAPVDAGVSGVGASAVGLLSNVASCLLSQSAQRIIDGAESDPWSERTEEDEAVRRARSGAQMLVSNMASLCRNATMLCEEGVAASDAHAGEGGDLAIQVDQMLEKSPVGAMLPSLVSVVALLLKFHGSKMIDDLPAVVTSIGPLMTQVKMLLTRLPVERHVAAAGAGGKLSSREERKEVESLHPYLDNTDEMEELYFPSARRITITFDEQSRTENGYDYVRIYKDSACTVSAHPGIDKLHGRNGDQNFPGFDGRPPLVVEGDRVVIKWRTDGSNTDWGWKATFVAEIDVQETAVAEQAHWLLALDRHLANCGGQVSAALIRSLSWGEGVEDEMAEWLEGDLVEKAREATTEEEAKLLDALTFWTDTAPGADAEPNLGAALVVAMKKKVPTDVGKIHDVDRAVYATAALMIKANGLLKEAVCCASGERQPSGALTKIWRTAQNMRQYFMFGDVAADVQSKKQLAKAGRRPTQKKPHDKTHLESSDLGAINRGSVGGRESLVDDDDDDDDAPEGPTLSAQPSLFAGAEDEVVREYADRICKRVNFLLGATTADGAVDRSHRKTPSLMRSDSTAGHAAGDGGRWSMLARTVGSGLTRGSSMDLKHASGEWKNLVERAKAAEDLKDAMRYRRKVAERRKESKMPSASEKILKFVQLPSMRLDILEKVIKCRGQRAQWRHKGLQLAHALLDSVFAPRALANLLAAIGEAMRDTRRDDQPDTHVHYANGVEGIDLTRRAALESSFMLFLKGCVSQLREKLAAVDLGSIDNGLADFALSVVRVCTIDYDVIDHDILSQSGLPEILPVLDAVDGESEAVKALRRAAWASTEILMLRCVGLHDQRMLPSAPTAAGQDLFRLFQKDLNDIAGQSASLRGGAATFAELTATPHAVPILADFADISPAVTGIATPHVSFGFGFSLTFWLKRGPSSVERRDDFVQGRSAKIGDRVMQGPVWDEESDGPASLLARGTVTGLSPDKVDVRWDGATEIKSHVWNDTAKRTVAVVDDKYGYGSLFYKGCLSALDRRLAWSLFGADLLPDGSVAFVISTDEDVEAPCVLVRSASVLPVDTWCPVTVTCSEPAVREGEGESPGDDASRAAVPSSEVHIYVNGKKDADPLILTDVMLTPGQGMDFEKGPPVTWETAHPYEHNMNQYEMIRVPGAAAYEITFDPQSVTEQNYDYVQFFRGESRTGDRHGLEKYTGRAFPPLTIDEPAFTIHFVTDGSNNEWGIRMTITPLVPKTDVAVDADQPLNEMPIYIGQAPQHIATSRAASVRIGGLQLHRHVLTPEAVAAQAEVAATLPQEASLPVVDNARGVFLCSLLARCATSMAGFGMTRMLSQPDMLAMVLQLCARGPSTSTQLRLAAHRLAAVLVRVTDPVVVDNQYSMVLTGAPQKVAFVDGLLSEIGECLFSWVKTLAPDAAASGTEANKALGFAKVDVLRGLVEIDAWKVHILGSLEAAMKSVGPLLERLSASAKPGGPELAEVSEDLHRLLGALHVLGGTFLGICPGVRALATVQGRTAEPCTVLAVTTPPPLNTGAASKAERKKRLLDGYCHTDEERDAWAEVDEDLDAVGDAVVVCFNSSADQPPVTLPAPSITVEDEVLSDGVLEGLAAIAPGILEALEVLVRVDARDDALALEPLVSDGHVEQTYTASAHAGENINERTIAIPGAEKLTVTFDRLTRSSGDQETMQFFSDSSRTTIYGSFSGGTWPGVAGMEPLVVPGSEVFVRYDSPGAVPFSYSFTVTADVKSEEAPPSVPPQLAPTVLKALRAHALKALATLLKNKNCTWLTGDAGHLAPAIIDAAIEPALEEDRNVVKPPKPIVLESAHPYSHNADEYYTVAFPPGFHMLVTFSENTRSENNCDYLKLYKDERHSEFWGAERYMGGKDGTARNWPGTDDNPALSIEAHEVVVFWHTDGSVNDWGWKMRVEAVLPQGGVANGGDLPLPVLTDRIFHFTSIMAEGHKLPAPVAPEELARFSPKERTHTFLVPTAPEELETIAAAMEEEIGSVEEETNDPVAKPVSDEDALPEFVVVRNRRSSGLTPDKKIVESAHPYADNHDSTEDIFFAGADSITIVFDAQTSTEASYDWVKFTLRDGASAHPGQDKFSGGRGGTRKVFPGLDNVAPLLVSGEFVQLHFHTDGSNNDWGFKFTATPDYPTRLMLRPNDDAEPQEDDLKLQARVEVLKENGDWILVRSRPPGTGDALTAVVESVHPYLDNEDVRAEVRLPRAAYLTIVFDPESSTEALTDHIGFHANAADSNHVYYLDGGDPQVFSGGRGGGVRNFPGVGELGPLRVRGEAVTYRWRSDNSNTDWGYRFTARGVTHADAPPFNPERGYTRYRLVVFRVRSRGNGVQLQEVRFFDATGTQLRPSGVDAPSGSSPSGEACDNLLRGSHDKWFDGRYTDLVFEFATPTRVASYQFVTANDCPGRDPTSWMLEASTDGENWTGADDVGNAEYVMPSERHAATPRFYLGSLSDGAAAVTRESTHGGGAIADSIEEVTVPGAVGFEIRFSPQCSVAPGEGGFAFYARPEREGLANPAGLDRIDGGVGYARCYWPGVLENPVHVIYGDSFYYAAHTDNAEAWGFQFTATPLRRPSEELRAQREAAVPLEEEAHATAMAARRGEAEEIEAVDHYRVGVTDIPLIPGAKVGWLKRREADVEYLVPADALVEDELPLLTLDPDVGPDGNDEEEMPGSVKNPLFEVAGEDDAEGTGGNAASVTLSRPVALASGRLGKIASSVAFTYGMASPKLAHAVLARLVEAWPRDVPLSTSLLGGEARLLAFVRLMYTERSLQPALRKRITESVAASTGEASGATVNTLLRYSLTQLSKAVQLSPLRHLRKTKCRVQVVETPHEYHNNMHEVYHVRLPGARAIHLEFDPRCATEKDCDYLTIYRNAACNTHFGEQKYHGRSGSQNFPGLAGRPPLKLEADEFWAVFHTDGSNTDWGIRMTARGVIEEASDEEKEEYRRHCAEKGPADDAFACWILEMLAQDEQPAVRRALYSKAALGTYRVYLESMPAAKRAPLLSMLVPVFQELPKAAPFSADQADAIYRLQGTLRNTIGGALQNEGNAGGFAEVLLGSKPRIVQALVQATVAMDAAVEALEELQLLSRDLALGDGEEKEEDGVQESKEAAAEAAALPAWSKTRHAADLSISQGNQNVTAAVAGGGLALSAAPFRPDATASWVLHLVHLGASNAPPLFGLVPEGGRSAAADLASAAARLGSLAGEVVFALREDSLHVALGEASADLGISLREKDVLAFRLRDASEGASLEVSRNGVSLGVVVGPAGSGAKLKGYLDAPSYFVAASPARAGDALLLRSCPAELLSGADSLVGTGTRAPRKSAEEDPTLAEIRSVSMLLTAFSRHELPPAFLQKAFLPAVRARCTRRIQLLGAATASETIHVPGAENLRVFVEGLSGAPQALKAEVAVPVAPTLAAGATARETMTLWELPCRGSGTELPSYALDNDSSTLWSGIPDVEGGPVWMILDLLRTHMLTAVGIEAVAGGQATVRFSVLDGDTMPSPDDPRWFLVAAFPMVFGRANNFDFDESDRAQARGRFVKLSFAEWVMVNSLSLCGAPALGGAEGASVTEADAGAMLQGAILKVNAAGFSEPKLKQLLQAKQAMPADEAPKETLRSRGLGMGGTVVRGPHWYWGAQDGGPGGVGEVTGFQPWAGKPGGGVRVRWRISGYEGLYRWDVEGKHDLKRWDEDELLPEAPMEPAGDEAVATVAAAGVKEEESCFVVRGDQVELFLDGGSPRAQLSLRIEPVFGAGAEARLPELFPEVHADLQAAFMSGTPANDRALVSHVNRVAKKKRLLMTSDVVQCSWAEVRPDEKDLIRDRCLRELVEMGRGAGAKTASLDTTALQEWFPSPTKAQAEALAKALPGEGGPGAIQGLRYEDAVAMGDGWAKWTVEVSQRATYELALLATAPATTSPPKGSPDGDASARAGTEASEDDGNENDGSVTDGSAIDDSATDESADVQIWEDGSAEVSAVEVEPQASATVHGRVNTVICTGIAGAELLQPKEGAAQPTWTLLARRVLLHPGTNILEIFAPEASLLPHITGLLLRPAKAPDHTMAGAGDAELPQSPAEGRFRLIQALNGGIFKALPYMDFGLVEHSWSLAGQLSECRGIVFAATKEALLSHALRNSATASAGFSLTINRPRARRFIGRGETDAEGRWSTFGQAFRAVHPRAPKVLRGAPNARLWNTIFAGEFAHDAGGPYNECWSQFAQELQSTALPLLLRCPNGVHSVGENRDRWLVNPGARSATQRAMFRFLGKLMGAAARTRNYLNLSIAPVVWKLVAGERVGRGDLASVDRMIVQTMDKMRHVDREGVTAELFSDVFDEVFTTMSLDDRIVPLRPGGTSEAVTYENRGEYADLVETYRLHEMDEAAAAIREGLGTVLPGRMITSLFTGDELERQVCGVQEIDVALLASVTEYSGCNKTDRHIGFFWEALEGFDHEERAALLRFTWGRSRLPMTVEEFSQRFKLQSFSHRPADIYLPVAHTCFFSLELPAYSTLEIMQEKLRYAIHNCQAIDGDDTSVGMAAAALGWEAD